MAVALKREGFGSTESASMHLHGKGTANCYFGSVASSRAPLIGHVANLIVGGQWPRRQGAVPGKFQRSTFATPIKPRITCRAVHDPHKLLGLELLCVLPRSPFMDNFRIADNTGIGGLTGGGTESTPVGILSVS